MDVKAKDLNIGKCQPIKSVSIVYRVKADLNKLKAYLDQHDPELRSLTIHIDDFIALGKLGCPKSPEAFSKKYKISLSVCGGAGVHPEPGFPEIGTWPDYYKEPQIAALLVHPNP